MVRQLYRPDIAGDACQSVTDLQYTAATSLGGADGRLRGPKSRDDPWNLIRLIPA